MDKRWRFQKDDLPVVGMSVNFEPNDYFIPEVYMIDCDDFVIILDPYGVFDEGDD